MPLKKEKQEETMHELKHNPIFAEAVRRGSHSGDPFQWGVQRRLYVNKKKKLPKLILAAVSIVSLVVIMKVVGK